MPTENQNHPDDHAAIERLHQQYVGKIERFSDDLMAFQDAAYAMGLERGKLLEAKRADALQQRLTAADERVDTAISLLECVLDTGELTREKHLDLEADICRLVTDFWGDRKSARTPPPPRCPDCGYTEQDCREQMDHHLCGSPEPAPARNP